LTYSSGADVIILSWFLYNWSDDNRRKSSRNASRLCLLACFWSARP